MRALIALALNERNVDGPSEHRMQFYLDLQRIDQRLSCFAHGALPCDVKRLRVVVEVFEHLEEMPPQALDVSLRHLSVSFVLG